MGCYLNDFGEGHFDKVEKLVELGAERLASPEFIDPSTGEVTICVVTNPMFQAAGVVHSPEEFDAFVEFDGRPRTFLKMSVETVKQYSPLDRYLSR